MKYFSRIVLTSIILVICAGLGNGQHKLESLDRGLVAVATDAGIYVGWRLLASDPAKVTFNIYRGDARMNQEPLATSTNYIDANGSVNDAYSVAPVIDGGEGARSAAVTPWSRNYRTIPLQKPAGGRTPDGVNYTYSPNDASAADLDGDGQYELVLKWDPSNAKDNSQSGYTGNVYLDGLEMDGTLLWRIDLGRNIRAGAHYTQFMVYDLDGDGRAEIACKTADATIDGVGAVIGNADANYRNSGGYILSGPEYFTIFDGLTGAALATTDYLPARGNVGSWGDTYGNRVDRFLAGVAYLDGERPSVIMCRGYYTRTVLVAWDWRDGQLTNRWIFDSNAGYTSYAGQGNHQLSVADLDADGKDEIVYGAMAIDDDGAGLWNSRLGHGDALHVSDIDPGRSGLEIWGIHENATVGSALLEGATGKVIWGTGPGDVGRGVSANVDDSQDGMECWGGTDGLRSARNVRVGGAPPSSNHVVWWDDDLARELLDGNNIRKYGGSHPTLLLASGCSANNGSKSNPSLQADLYGDWREEVIWRTNDNAALRIYTTTALTPHRLVTLMHDRQYRLAIAWQNVAYNQPPHTSYFIGASMLLPDSLRPPSTPINVQTIAWQDTVLIKWDANTDSDLAGYRLYRGRSEENLTISIDVGLTTSYLDTDVRNDSTYYYAVAAYDFAGNESAHSDVVKAVPTIRPEAPSGITFRHDANSIMLIWDSQDFAHISRVFIYRSETANMTSARRVTKLKSVRTHIDRSLTTGKTFYYTLTVVDTAQIESFPSPVLEITPAASFTMQAEDAEYNGTVYVEDNHVGFHGTAFTNFESDDSAVEFTNMPGFGGGERTLIFRYALGNTNRTGALIVNGVAQNLTMRGSGEWTNYVLDSVAVTLNAGYDNTIRFAATGNDFGNLDEITIVPKAQTAVERANVERTIPSDFQLYQNYPNPFNPQTTLSFGLPEAARVRIDIYDMNGRLVRAVVNENYQPAIHEVKFNGAHLASGVYFVQTTMHPLHTQGFEHRFTKKIMLLK
ncbi:T9SS type A sorting domain-containing protein [candidate division KSB1 bacterium]|nr:T9SS type A sorting domain-containing protein [candidate division KSB1 bacterium]